MSKQVPKELPLQFMKGVGPKRAKALAKHGIITPYDLIFYFPRDYIYRDSSLTLASLAKKLKFNFSEIFKDSKDELQSEDELKRKEYSFIVEIVNKEIKTFGPRRRLLLFNVKDEHGGTAKINFWRGIHYFSDNYNVGQKLLISGKPEYNKYGLAFTHPEIDRIEKRELSEYKNEGILPLYSMPAEFIRTGIRTRVLREIIQECLDSHLASIQETLDKEVIEKFKLPDIQTTIENLHFPNSEKLLKLSRNRFKFEEMLFYQLLILQQKKNFTTSEKAPKMGESLKLSKELLGNLPFELTKDQRDSLNKIWKKMNSNSPMNMLLQGDVGSGKTIVALAAMIIAVESGYQALIMAPTEILAKQHYQSLLKFLDSDIRVELLVGGLTAKNKKEALGKIKNGMTDIIIGTHALFQEVVEYNNLGIVVIDEQHRFGVNQRAMLKELGKKSGNGKLVPHMLIMTATPIPRTLSMTKYTDLDTSIIRTMPKNRKKIITKLRFEQNLPDIYNFIEDQVGKGRQAFIVYPLVEDSDKLDLKSATEHYEKLSKDVFKDLRCALLHGQMHWKEKDEIMQDFAAGKYDILISTTVIEVGIDVPNANIMLIENAERFGLSQLHQLRGRVGRGEDQSYCVLVASNKYKSLVERNMEDIPTVQRLKAMENTSDGFKLSEIDLKLRGPGDVIGTQQSGMPDFKFIDFIADTRIIESAKKEAENIVDTGLNKENYPRISESYKKIEAKGKYLSIG